MRLDTYLCRQDLASFSPLPTANLLIKPSKRSRGSLVATCNYIPQLSPTQPYVLVTEFIPEREKNPIKLSPNPTEPRTPAAVCYCDGHLWNGNGQQWRRWQRGERPLLHCFSHTQTKKRKNENQWQRLVHHLPHRPTTAPPFSFSRQIREYGSGQVI